MYMFGHIKFVDLEFAKAGYHRFVYFTKEPMSKRFLLWEGDDSW